MHKQSSSCAHTCLTVLSALFLFSLTTSAHAQTALIKRNGWYRNAPIEVFDLKVKDKVVSFGEAFEADADWLKDVSLKIKNTSKKTIVCIPVGLVFPETAPSPMMHLKLFGNPTNSKVRDGRQSLELKPGEVLAVSLADEYERLKALVEHRRSIDSIGTLTLETNRAYFDDGMMWDMGGLYRPDPDNFGKWILVEKGVWIPPM